MKDSLEGSRPGGVDLGKRTATGTLASDRSSSARPLMIAAILAVLVMIAAWAFTRDENATVPPKPTVPASKARNTPERTHTGSVMEKVVIASYTPAVRDEGDYDESAHVTLIGRDGLEIRRRLPMSCEDAPIIAREHRVILVRSDTWRLRGGGEETMLSDDDAEAALCGDFRGRDVAMPKARRKAGAGGESTPASTDAPKADEDD
jgi:hypothetical protein